MARIEAATVKGSVFYTDEFTSYNDLARFGKHVPIDHGEEFADGAAHINGIEGFWSYAKRLHRLCHGVDRENFPLYLAEYEFRYNHRDEHLLTLESLHNRDLPGGVRASPLPIVAQAYIRLCRPATFFRISV
jgi:transposase